MADLDIYSIGHVYPYTNQYVLIYVDWWHYNQTTSTSSQLTTNLDSLVKMRLPVGDGIAIVNGCICYCLQ